MNNSTLPSLLAISAVLTACSGTSNAGADLQQYLNNPLYAEQYYDAQADHMADLVIQNDALSTDEKTKGLLDSTRTAAMKKASEATEQQSKGIIGSIDSDYSYTHGEALLLENTLYFGPEFAVQPGPDLHVFISTAVDPRVQKPFPDSTAIDLGPIQSAFGVQQYTIDASHDLKNYRSVAIYDMKLKRIYGFAQLQKR